uniref:Uncharacterized protein n=1 Tax=Meloidogyne enterolobii TaxID=390850 RepID=A0A6V7W186_MELEN|nr:unnamed protein product [Meloidogyne enterolobii]
MQKIIIILIFISLICLVGGSDLCKCKIKCFSCGGKCFKGRTCMCNTPCIKKIDVMNNLNLI